MYKIGDKVYCIPDLEDEFEPIEGIISVRCDYQDKNIINIKRLDKEYHYIERSENNIFYNKKYCEEATKLMIQFYAFKKADTCLENKKIK